MSYIKLDSLVVLCIDAEGLFNSINVSGLKAICVNCKSNDAIEALEMHPRTI